MSRAKLSVLSLVLTTLVACNSQKKEQSQATPPSQAPAGTQSASNQQSPPPGASPVNQQPEASPAPAPAPPRAARAPAPRHAPRKAAPKRHNPLPEEQRAASALPPAASIPETNPPVSRESEPPTPVVPERPRYSVVPSGTALYVRLTEPLDSSINRTGDKFQAVLDQDVAVDGRTVIPRGSTVTGKLTHVQEAGRVEGRAEMALVLTDIAVGNESYSIRTNTVTQEAESTKKQDAAKVGAGAGIGAVIGAIAGGGKGAAIGAVVGGAAGGGSVLATRGKPVKFPAEHQLSFTLRQDLQVR